VPPSPGTVETQDYGDLMWSSRRCRLLQTRRWRGQFYDVAFELVTNDEAKEVVLRTPETTYFPIGVERMAVLMEEAGFTRVRRIDGCLFQPVLVGTRSVSGRAAFCKFSPATERTAPPLAGGLPRRGAALDPHRTGGLALARP